MEKQKMVQEIREECVAANPEIESGQFLQQWSINKENTNPKVCVVRPIRLADVLLVVGDKQLISKYGFSVNAYGGMYQTTSEEDWKEKYVAEWNLRADDLEQQSDECVSFIHSLLFV